MSTLLLRQIHPPEEGGLSFTEKAKAGVLVFRESPSKKNFEVLLVHRLKQDDWSFPKGHVESHEWLMEAALREVHEECGIRPMILGRLQNLAYKDGKGEPVELAMYLGKAIFDEPLRATEKEESRWVNFREVETTLSYENLKEYWREFVKPILNKKTTNEGECDIIFSSNESYQLGARALASEVGKRVKSEAIDLKTFQLETKRSRSRLLYFLTDFIQARTASFWAEELEHAYVFNKSALSRWGSKSMIQQQLGHIGIPVPRLFPYAMREQDKIPKEQFILKSELHGIRRKGIFERFLRDPWLLYHEKNLRKGGFEEYKVWCVGGLLFAQEKSILSQELYGCIHRIQSALGLEALSIDLFRNKKGKFYIIDVNRAPAFFQNPGAREAFGEYAAALSRLL